MRVQTSNRYVALVALAGALACAGNKARTSDGNQPDQAAAARDTTSGRDTTQNPPGYRGMERDTSVAPGHQPTPTDTFLQKQGQGAPQDTAGYSGIERDTTGRQGQANPSSQASPSGQTDTSGYNANPSAGRDTSGMSGMDSTMMHMHGDSTGMSKSADTTGYKQSQDTTTSR